MLRRFASALLLSLAASALLPAMHSAHAQSPREAAARATSPENYAFLSMEAARKAGPLALHAFLERMPKGADLHMHLSGAVYAETFLKNAAEDQLCVDPVKLAFVKNTGLTKSLPPQPTCPDGDVPVSVAFSNTPAGQRLYDSLVDSFSMRSFVPTPGTTGHDQFFATFGRFGGTGKQHVGEWLDEVSTRAAAQNEQYLEIMQTPSFAHAATLGYQFGWPSPPHPVSTAGSSVSEDSAGTSRAELSALRDKLLAAGLRDEVATDSAELSEALAARTRIQHCGEPSAAPGCSVQIRFLFQVLRQFPPQQVFAQTLLAFEVASVDPNVVGLNFVQPEDAYLAMAEYHRQMLMLDYLHSVYPKVHISLHAGELAPGIVPPAALRFHIREAVDLGHAERIGHGVDVMYEADSALLLKELADRHIMVEINLTSNDGILGILAPNHPLPAYRAAHVPVALSTDDEGVSRIDLTHEYTRAALEFGLTYYDLKQMARTGIAHTFLPGPDLFQHPDDFSHVASACSGQTLGADTPRPACLSYLQSSPHATQQWELEHRFRRFESTQP